MVLVYRIVQHASRAIDQILPLLADNALDLNSLTEVLGRDSAEGWGVGNIALIGIAGCWLAAIVHAYFVGKKIDRQSRPDL